MKSSKFYFLRFILDLALTIAAWFAGSYIFGCDKVYCTNDNVIAHIPYLLFAFFTALRFVQFLISLFVKPKTTPN